MISSPPPKEVNYSWMVIIWIERGGEVNTDVCSFLPIHYTTDTSNF